MLLPKLPMTLVLGLGLGWFLGGLIVLVLASLPPLSWRCC
jgi:hypothetical protein